MKHGKAKSKAASKASGKKSSKSSAAVKVSAKSSKASPVSKKQQQQTAGKSSGKSVAPANGKPVRLAPGDVHFTNATVGNAFKRAVKKYPNAFRRLTD